MSQNQPHTPHNSSLEAVDVTERGAAGQTLDRQLFMQLSAFRLDSEDALALLQTNLQNMDVPCVVYLDVNDPRTVAVLSWSEQPAFFVQTLRAAFNASNLVQRLALRPELTMLGRTYSSGYEQDLAYWILRRPIETALNPDWPWAVWYPLRRSGAFARLEPREQGQILREHGQIGRAYAEADLAHDIRLACHGLDAHDNEFVIGLVGRTLQPLSHIVQRMRQTRQTSEFIAQMGPFFVGYAHFRNAGNTQQV